MTTSQGCCSLATLLNSVSSHRLAEHCLSVSLHETWCDSLVNIGEHDTIGDCGMGARRSTTGLESET